MSAIAMASPARKVDAVFQRLSPGLWRFRGKPISKSVAPALLFALESACAPQSHRDNTVTQLGDLTFSSAVVDNNHSDYPVDSPMRATLLMKLPAKVVNNDMDWVQLMDERRQPTPWTPKRIYPNNFSHSHEAEIVVDGPISPVTLTCSKDVLYGGDGTGRRPCSMKGYISKSDTLYGEFYGPPDADQIGPRGKALFLQAYQYIHQMAIP